MPGSHVMSAGTSPPPIHQFTNSPVPIYTYTHPYTHDSTHIQLTPHTTYIYTAHIGIYKCISVWYVCVCAFGYIILCVRARMSAPVCIYNTGFCFWRGEWGVVCWYSCVEALLKVMGLLCVCISVRVCACFGNRCAGFGNYRTSYSSVDCGYISGLTLGCSVRIVYE